MIDSIKHRLFITFGSLSVFICALFAGLIWLIAAETEDEVVKQVLNTEASYLLEQYKLEGSISQPRVDYIRLYISESEIPKEILSGYKSNLGEKEFIALGDNYHMEVFESHNGETLYLTLNASKVEGLTSVSKTIWYSLLIASSMVLCLALFLAWVLSNQSAKPLEQLSKVIEKHNVGQSLPCLPEHRKDEIGKLSRSFISALQQIAELLKREKTFTRDVSHELRTPITLIKNTILLNTQKVWGESDIEIIEYASNELEQTVNVLLALARQENLEYERVKLVPVIEKCVLEIYNIHPHISFQVDIDIDDNHYVFGNEYLIKLLFQNLINNAFYHSSSSIMKVSIFDNNIVVENPLIGSQEKPHYQGLGHGHYLVTRIVEEMNWQVSSEKIHDTYRVVISAS